MSEFEKHINDLFGDSERPSPEAVMQDLRNQLRYFSAGIKHICQSGSRVICDPPVLNTDQDYLMLVEDLDAAGIAFQSYRYLNCLDEWLNTEAGDRQDYYSVELEAGARFQAWRFEDINVIVTDDETLHLRSVAATLLAKQLNLQTKAERIKLFRCIKFGEEYAGRYT